MKRRKLVGLVAMMALLLGISTTAHALPVATEDPIVPVPEGVWIRGQKVQLEDTKQCWKRGSKPVLLAKVAGKYVQVAKGKLAKTNCDPEYPYEATYRFVLKHGGGAEKLTLKSTDSSGVGETYKRTVYASMAEYNETVGVLLGWMSDAINGVDEGSEQSSPNGSASSSNGWSGCNFRGQYMAGTVKVVDFGFADFTVKRVNIAPDLKVKPVQFFPNSCGEWKFTDFGFADFTIKFVDYGIADFSIQLVDFFPGR